MYSYKLLSWDSLYMYNDTSYLQFYKRFSFLLFLYVFGLFINFSPKADILKRNYQRHGVTVPAWRENSSG